jgi:hypothetical protein
VLQRKRESSECLLVEIIAFGAPGLLLLGPKRLAGISKQLVLEHLCHYIIPLTFSLSTKVEVVE